MRATQLLRFPPGEIARSSPLKRALSRYERNAGEAERALDAAMIRPGRLERDTIRGRLREPFDQRVVTALRSQPAVLSFPPNLRACEGIAFFVGER
jgi:hypothetical protein